MKVSSCTRNRVIPSRETIYHYSSNIKHKIAKHPHCLNKIEKVNLKRQSESSLDNTNECKQQKLERWGSGTSTMTQNALDDAIMEFIIDTLQPFSVVDNQLFINLVRKRLPSSICIMCRQTLKEKLYQKYCKMKTALEAKLVEVEVISTTADLWSKMKRSYLGITAHWIDKNTLKRESAILACRRIKGKHTYDILAKAIKGIPESSVIPAISLDSYRRLFSLLIVQKDNSFSTIKVHIVIHEGVLDFILKTRKN